MNEKSYNKLMHYLDIIELEMDKIAIMVGHPTRKEFFAMKKKIESECSSVW